MPCPCCQPPDIDGIESFFDSARAQTEADAYLRAGLDARSARLIDYLLRNAGGALRLLDIGGGVGGVHYELLRRGAAQSAVAVEASSAYIDAARSIGRELGLDDRVNYLHADFARSADAIDGADAVVLDRVICCYPRLGRPSLGLRRQGWALPCPQLPSRKVVGLPHLQAFQPLPLPQTQQFPHLPPPPQRRSRHRRTKRP